MPATRSRRSSSKVITYAVLNSFQGGISAQPDKVQLPMGFTPMARNVEWYPKGGFFVRKGVGALTRGQYGEEMQPPTAVPVRFHHYIRDPAILDQFTSQYLLATADGGVLVGVDFGTELTVPGYWLPMWVAGVPLGTIGPPTFTAWDTNVYISLGSNSADAFGTSMVRWDGAVATALGTAWANDLAAPTGGNMPTGRYTGAWSERMWVACLIPDITATPTAKIEGSRIRWSHPGKPEDWAENDYIDVGQQGDVITGIAPMRDMLVIFKRSSMYALLGSGSTNFRLVELSGTIGCTGEWTRDNQGSIAFWDATMGLCRFDGKSIANLFEPCRPFLESRAITRCGGVVTDGDKIYVATDFQDFYGERVPDPFDPEPLPPGATVGATVTWQELIDQGITWGALATQRWLRSSVEFYSLVWVYREGAGWTSFTLKHPGALDITMLGQVRSRATPQGDVESNRRIVYGLNTTDFPIYLSDQHDDGTDWWRLEDEWHYPIDSFYMTPWLHGGLPAQIKRWKAPRVIQEADDKGILLIDVFYDFNYDFLRRTLRVGVVTPLSFDSYSVGKPGTIGRAKAVMLVVRPEFSDESKPRHWGVSSITVPIHPKVLR